MTPPIRYALLAGAALVIGTGTALAASHQGPRGHHNMMERMDTNHDGQITKAEFDAATAARFKKMSGGADSITLANFGKDRSEKMRERSDKRFGAMDWNGNGTLSLEEYAAPLRARFIRRDRDGTGTISCAPHDKKMHDKKADGEKSADGKAMHMGMHKGMHRGMRHGKRGGIFCMNADTNKNGSVTRAEFDASIKAQFDAAATNGALSKDAFYQMKEKRADARKAKRFERLDTNKDGKVTLEEFSARQDKMFTRMDKNKDGVISKDEMKAMHHKRGHWNHDKKDKAESK